MAYSRAHYRLVSPREDTRPEIEWRKRDNQFRAQTKAERDAKYPTITAENLNEASDWFNARLQELHGR